MPDSRVKADEVEPLGGALMLLPGMLDLPMSVARQCLNTWLQKLIRRHYLLPVPGMKTHLIGLAVAIKSLRVEVLLMFINNLLTKILNK